MLKQAQLLLHDFIPDTELEQQSQKLDNSSSTESIPITVSPSPPPSPPSTAKQSRAMVLMQSNCSGFGRSNIGASHRSDSQAFRLPPTLTQRYNESFARPGATLNITLSRCASGHTRDKSNKCYRIINVICTKLSFTFVHLASGCCLHLLLCYGCMLASECACV